MADFTIPGLPFIPIWNPAPPSSGPASADARELRDLRAQLDVLVATLPAGSLVLDIPGEGGGRTFGQAADQVRSTTTLPRPSADFEALLKDKVFRARRELSLFEDLVARTDFERLLERPRTYPGTPPPPELPPPTRPPTLPEGWMPGDLTPPNPGTRPPIVVSPPEPPPPPPPPAPPASTGARLLQGGISSLPGIARTVGRVALRGLEFAGPILDQLMIWDAYLNPAVARPGATNPRRRGGRRNRTQPQVRPPAATRATVGLPAAASTVSTRPPIPAVEANIWGEPVVQANTGKSPGPTPTRRGVGTGAQSIAQATARLRTPDYSWLTFLAPQSSPRSASAPTRVLAARPVPQATPIPPLPSHPSLPGLGTPTLPGGSGLPGGLSPLSPLASAPSTTASSPLASPGAGGIDDICRARAAEDRRRRRKKQKDCPTPKFINRKVRVCGSNR